MMKMRMYLFIGGALVIVFFGAALLTRPHWWVRTSQGKVSYRDSNSPQSVVYRSSKGDVLVAVKHGGERALYIVETSLRQIGMPNRSAFCFLPGFVYSKDVPPLCAPMGKAGVLEQLVIEQRKIEFTSFENARVKVTW
jgi:hypothetical protein